MNPRGNTETVQQTTEFEKNISGCGKMGQVNCSLTMPLGIFNLVLSTGRDGEDNNICADHYRGMNFEVRNQRRNPIWR